MGKTPITIARQKVSVIHPDIPDLDWHKGAGAKITHTVSKMRTTGMGKKIPLDGGSETENFTTEAALRLPEMGEFRRRLRAKEKFEGTTIITRQFDVDGVEVGKDELFNCMVVGVEFPEADANNENGDAASVIVEWAMED